MIARPAAAVAAAAVLAAVGTASAATLTISANPTLASITVEMPACGEESSAASSPTGMTDAGCADSVSPADAVSTSGQAASQPTAEVPDVDPRADLADSGDAATAPIPAPAPEPSPGPTPESSPGPTPEPSPGPTPEASPEPTPEPDRAPAPDNLAAADVPAPTHVQE